MKKWKIYLWINAVLTSLTFINGLINPASLQSLKINVWITWILGIVTVLGLYSFVYKRKLLNNTFWKIIFWLNIMWLILYIISVPPLDNFLPSWLLVTSYDQWAEKGYSTGMIIFSHIFFFILGGILFFPEYYAIYKIAYISKKKPAQS